MNLYLFFLTTFLFQAAMTLTKGEDCPLYEVDFSGNDIACIDKIKSWGECGRLCNHMTLPEPCKFWTWNSRLANGCCMKRSNANRISRAHHYSGDSDCWIDGNDMRMELEQE